MTALAGAIALMESQIEAMRGNIAALKSSKVPKEKKKKEKREKPPVASSSKAFKPAKPSSKKKNVKKTVSDNDVLTFEQKKDLSENIAKLDEDRLERVIRIIHDGVPEIRDVSVLFLLNITGSNVSINRVRTKSNWKLTRCRRRSLPNFTTLSSVLCVRLSRSATGLAKALGLEV